MISVDHLCYHYKGGRPILRDSVQNYEKSESRMKTSRKVCEKGLRFFTAQPATPAR